MIFTLRTEKKVRWNLPGIGDLEGLTFVDGVSSVDAFILRPENSRGGIKTLYCGTESLEVDIEPSSVPTVGFCRQGVAC